MVNMLASLYEILPSRVIFGVGCLAKLPEEIDRLGASRVLVLSTPRQRETGLEIAKRLGARAAGLFDRAAMHIPIEIAQEAREKARRMSADCFVAVGGGSTMGLAKAIVLPDAASAPLPILALPTSYAGSEMTPLWSLLQDGRETTGSDARVLPKTVLYDPVLTLGIPVDFSAVSGINAIANCIEALYAKDVKPVISTAAEEGIRALSASLPVVVKQPGNIEVRSQALYGAWLGGVALGSAGMALHYKLCHSLGGAFNLPHAEIHAVILPHSVAYNAPAAAEAIERVAGALGIDSAAETAAAALYDLAVRLGAPVSLAAIGMRAADLDRAADLAAENAYDNPRPVAREGIRALLQDAFDGKKPE
jgi:maleylacetate reductase